jgi:hypothetical protein
MNDGREFGVQYTTRKKARPATGLVTGRATRATRTAHAYS